MVRTYMSDKQILVIGEKTEDDDDNPTTTFDHGFEAENVNFGDDDRVTVKEIDPVGGGDKLRGYSPDLIVLTVRVSDAIMRQVIKPMAAMDGGEIIRLYE